MLSAALVELVMNVLSCSQKELASKIGVSPTQISKWKKGEHISFDMEDKLRGLINIGDKDPQFILLCGSFEEAEKWDKFIHYLADMAGGCAETGFDTYPLDDEMEVLSSNTFRTLKLMGVVLPDVFPESLNVFCQEQGEIGDDDFTLIYENPVSALIYDIFKALNDTYGFYAAYIEELIEDHELSLEETAAVNIEPCLLSLAACKIDVGSELATNYEEFKYKTLRDYQEWLTVVKNRAFRAGVPLRAELLDLINHSADQLGLDAEAESLGFTSTRIHPDVYMNELLVGVRLIHQVLPEIMKKLGIDEEFQLDLADLKN
jgi:transcriptional regulator with XRE-family HTH domain